MLTICDIAYYNFNMCSLSVKLRTKISINFNVCHYHSNIAHNNFNLRPLSVTIRRQLKLLFTICNIAHPNFNVCLICAALWEVISTSFYLQHCAQQFQCVFTICNIAGITISTSAHYLQYCHNNFNVCPLYATFQVISFWL